MKALVSIITVNYNGLRDTCEMIDSFRNHETIALRNHRCGQRFAPARSGRNTGTIQE